MGCVKNEPALNDLFSDPIVKAVMRRDSVDESDLRGLIERVRLSMAPTDTAADDRMHRDQSS
jgi:hypothetical protein